MANWRGYVDSNVHLGISKGVDPTISYVQLASGSILDGLILLFVFCAFKSMTDNIYITCLCYVLDYYFSGKSAYE